MRYKNVEVKSFSLTSLRNILTILVKQLLHSEVFSEPLPSETSSDFVNKVSNIHRQITHPAQDVTVEMKACVSHESFDSVSTETLAETVI